MYNDEVKDELIVALEFTLQSLFSVSDAFLPYHRTT